MRPFKKILECVHTPPSFCVGESSSWNKGFFALVPGQPYTEHQLPALISCMFNPLHYPPMLSYVAGFTPRFIVLTSFLETLGALSIAPRECCCGHWSGLAGSSLLLFKT
jgi:hypothetical protein